MYRGSSPIFDVPEFPPLRRVKPLPKRRRTSDDPLLLPDTTQYAPAMLPTNGPVDMTAFGLNMPLPQYYMPMFNGVQDLFRMSAANDDRSSQYPGGFAVPVGPVDEEDHGDGDYVDHLQQPANTKKRKVPAAHHSTSDPLGSPATLGSDEADERARSMTAMGRSDNDDISDVAPTLSPPAPPLVLRKNRTSAATLAGLQHKELLKTRKRQLAAVLGALSHGDTLALDQALSARYSNIGPLTGQNRTDGKENISRDRPDRRSNKRKTDGLALTLTSPESNSHGAPFPSVEFTFVCPSPTSERLISTRKEVAVLHSRFEAELSRQAAKAAEVARQNAAENGVVAKRDRNQQRSRTSGNNAVSSTGNGLIDSTGAGAKTRTSKKKKRSALANASNPHHLRNYVPSRIPHSGASPAHVQAGANALNLVSPLPVRFLTAEIAPKRRHKKSAATVPTPSLAPLLQPEDEWICALCEYSLFYGEEPGFRRAIRSRKKILIRRRRARERAAAAANGQKTGVVPVDKGASETIESPLDEEYGDGELMHTGGRHGNGASKKERDKLAS
ncbi:hypothetical protein BU17DRAFT_49059 [Hysterangium stoloniferum]|nr:hypothetical protein BU17DRAFT_49059 [Hysterangium stoloniferum]